MANGDNKKKEKSFLEKADAWIKEKAGARGKKARETAKSEPAPAPAPAVPTERRSTRDQIRDDRTRTPLNPEDSPNLVSFKSGGKGGTGRSSAMESKKREKRLGGIPI